MKTSIRVIPLLAAALSASPLTPWSTARAASVDDLIAHNLESKGSDGKLNAIQTLSLRGKLIVNGGQLKLEFAEMLKRGGMIRQEATLQGLTVIQAYDGKEGWQINPFQGRKTPERMSPDDAKALIEDSDIGGPLANAKADQYQVEYAGTEDVDGTDAIKLKITRPGGDIQYVYLDPDHYLEIRSVSQRTEHGSPVEIQTDYGDYEQVAGVYFPFSIVSGRKGSSDKTVIQFDKGDVNVDLPDSSFHFPAAAAPAPAAAGSH